MPEILRTILVKFNPIYDLFFSKDLILAMNIIQEVVEDMKDDKNKRARRQTEKEEDCTPEMSEECKDLMVEDCTDICTATRTVPARCLISTSCPKVLKCKSVPQVYCRSTEGV